MICSVFVDDITNLRDHEHFRYLIEDELKARDVIDPKNPKAEPRRNPSFVAKIVGTRWVAKIPFESLMSLPHSLFKNHTFTEYTTRTCLLLPGNSFQNP